MCCGFPIGVSLFFIFFQHLVIIFFALYLKELILLFDFVGKNQKIVESFRYFAAPCFYLSILIVICWDQSDYQANAVFAVLNIFSVIFAYFLVYKIIKKEFLRNLFALLLATIISVIVWFLFYFPGIIWQGWRYLSS